MRSGNVCGAVSGAVIAIGLKCGFHVEGDFKQKGYCYSKTDEFLAEFKKQNGSLLCCNLLGSDIQKPEDFKKPEVQEAIKIVCPKLVASSVRIFEGFNVG